MRKYLVLTLTLVLLLSTAVAQAAIPQHQGDNDPQTEGWNRWYPHVPGFAGPSADGPSWMTKPLAAGNEAYYAGEFLASELPPSWQMDVTVKVVEATSDEGAFFALGDGTLIWELQVLTTPGSAGLYKKIRQAPGWAKLASFDPDGQFHAYTILKREANDFVIIKMDGVKVGQIGLSEAGSYTARAELQMGGGAWNNPSEAYWKSVYVGVPTSGTITGTITLQDYVGDTGLAPIQLDLRAPGTTDVLFSAKAFLDVDGVYTINDIEPGNYDVSIVACKWLKKVVSDVTVAANASVDVSASLVNGDVDGDNEVTSTDLSILGLGLGIAGDQ